jgi:hypothetical protein
MDLVGDDRAIVWLGLQRDAARAARSRT